MSALVAEARSLELRAAAAAETPTDAREGCLLRREGDFWLVVWGGRRARIEDAKGIRYLARLLRHPGEEFHVGELMRILAPEGIRGAFRPGHAGEDLDARAAAEYRRRLQEIEEASIPGAANADALEALRAEAEFIRRELSVARGLGGRRRRSVDDVERIRKTVSRRIRQSAERIARHHPPLGEHLRRSLQTGTFCTYRPREAGAWTVED